MNLTKGGEALLIAVISIVVLLVIFFGPALYRKIKKGLRSILEGGAHF